MIGFANYDADCHEVVNIVVDLKMRCPWGVDPIHEHGIEMVRLMTPGPRQFARCTTCKEWMEFAIVDDPANPESRRVEPHRAIAPRVYVGAKAT